MQHFNIRTIISIEHIIFHTNKLKIMGMVMLHGVLNIPTELCWECPIDQKARQSRYVEASNEIKRLEAENREIRSLIDGCYDIVTLWEAEFPSQKKWKLRWLEGARKHGATGF